MRYEILFIVFTEDMVGLQTGLVNYAKNLVGVQIGLINIHKNGKLPVMAIINAAF